MNDHKPQPTSAGAAGSADRGLHRTRVEIDDHTGRLEKALADLWESKNIPDPSLNYGCGLLQNLCLRGSRYALSPSDRVQVLHKVTDDERRVVATVVQWLGTPVGRCFLEEAFRKAGWSISMQPNAQRE